jgi:hypothetical protein
MDPESDPVTYHIQVAEGPNFTPPLFVEEQGLTDTTVTFIKNFIGTQFFWRVRARDAVGWGPWSPVWDFFTDRTPPVTQVAPLPQWTQNANFTVSWAGTDDSAGMSLFDIFVSDGNGSTDFFPWLENQAPSKKSAVFSGKDNHTYNFYSIGTDAAFNREDPPGSPDATTTVDTTPPVTTMGPLAAVYGKTDFSVSWTGKDATSGIQYYNVFFAIGDSDFEPWLEQTPKTSSEFEGEGGQRYTFYAIGCDRAGNWEQQPAPAKMARTMVDLTAPTATVRFGNPNTGADPVFVTASTQIFIDGSDELSGLNGTFYDIDGRSTMTYNAPVREGAPGSHNMTFWCVDKAGNRGQSSVAWFFVDIEAPAADIAFNGPGWQSGDKMYITANTTLVLGATDGGSGVNYIEQNIDKRSYTRYSSPIKFSSGTHSLSIRAQDKVGNVGTERTLTIVVDLTAPVTTIDADVPATSKDDVTVPLSPKDAESGVNGTFFRILFEKARTGDFQQGTQATIEASRGDGNYTLQYYSVDNVNNTERVKEIKVRIDTMAVLAFAFDGPQSTGSQTYLLQGRSEPGATLTADNQEAKAAADGTYAIELRLKPGKNTITVTATDAAGNTVQKQAVVTYNEPIASADWFLPLMIIVVVVAGVGVGGGIYMTMGRRAPPPPPARRAPPARPGPAGAPRAPPPKKPMMP